MIFLCAFAAFFAYVGISSAGDTLSASKEDFKASWNGASLIIESEELSEGELSRIVSAVKGTKTVSESYTYTEKCVCADGETRTVRFFGYPAEGLITQRTDVEGDFAISFGYAADFDRNAVTRLTLPDGREVSVTATAYMPNHTAVYTDRYTPATDGQVVDVICDVETVWELSRKRCVNGAVLSTEEYADLNEIKAALAEEKHIEYVTETSNYLSYKGSLTLGETVLKVCALFPWILLGTGMVFIIVFLSGVIDRSRRSVAVLLADGASVAQVIFAFFLSSVIAMACALAAAVPTSMVLSDLISRTALENMGLPYASPAFPLRHVLFCLGLTLVFSLASSAAGAAPLMRKGVKQIGRPVRRRRASALLDFLTVVFCSAAAMALVITTCMYRDSQAEIKREIFDDRYNYDVQVIYSDFVPSSDVSFLEECAEGVTASPAIIGTATLEFNGNTYSASGIGIGEDSDAVVLQGENGERIRPTENSVVLSRGASDALGAIKGDVISAAVHAGGREIRVMCTVSDVSAQNSAYTELFAIETVEDYLDSSGVMNCAFVNVDGDAHDFASEAGKLSDVYAVQTLDSAKTRFDGRYAGTDRLIKLIIGDGIMLSLFIFLLMSYRTWKRNLRRNRILVMLGESPLRLAFRDAVLRLAGAAAGLGAGYALAYPIGRQVLMLLSTESITFPFVMRLETAAASAGITLLFALSGALLYASPTLRQRA